MAETTSANYPAALANDTSLLGDHVNQKSLVLSGSHNTSVTTITTTANISGVNAPGYCLIDSELIHFTGVSGATLTTATRGANATTAATHADAATIYFVPVANWANQVKREIVATQTELGTDPAGAFTDVDTSLNTWLLGVTDGITANSTQDQSNATALTKGINRVTVVGTNGDGVKLPTAVAGLQILIINDDSAQTIQVWPATGDAIDGGSANAVDGSQISAGSARRYIAVDATNWYTATATGAVTSVSGSTGAVVDGDIDHDSLANFAASEHYTQANITTIGTVTSGTISTGAVIADATMTLGSDADGDMYYRASDVLTRLAKGSDNDTLMMNGNVPNWEAVAAASGKIGKVSVSAVYSTRDTTTSSSFVDMGGPAATAITPSADSSKILIMMNCAGLQAAANEAGIDFKRAIAEGATTSNISGATYGVVLNTGAGEKTPLAIFVDSPNTTAATTYTPQWRNQDGSTTIYCHNTTTASIMVLMEILA